MIQHKISQKVVKKSGLFKQSFFLHYDEYSELFLRKRGDDDEDRLCPGEHEGSERAERPVLNQLMEQLRPDHALMIWKLYRLGRSFKHIGRTDQ